MSIHQQHYQTLANTVIKNLEKRNMKGTYFQTKEEACEYMLSSIPKASSISWGGAMTLHEAGIIDALHNQKEYTLLDRAKAKPDEVDKLLRDVFFADYYLMSSNAITLDGKLVNIDGNGNRVAALIYGPKKVIIVAGMNKIVANEQEAISRVKNVASPLNTVRLNRDTPCHHTGHCHDCLAPDCICAHTVITRNSRHNGRIEVILVGEHLGY